MRKEVVRGPGLRLDGYCCWRYRNAFLYTNMIEIFTA